MISIYFATMLLLVAAGVLLVVSASSMPGLAAGLAMLAVGSGGVSAGMMTRDTERTPHI